ncbi:MAG: maleylpyruvate isomerase family mycothiol-dependent enzyme [Actinomycetota bacterium]|nr:maleylpyruvate isomerase family mycothiol-dependent enzyme [Actinomycetota bacterium]
MNRIDRRAGPIRPDATWAGMIRAMDHQLTNDSYLAHLAADGRALIAAVEAAPDARVAACPEWTNTGLAEHVATVWNFAIAQVESGDPSGPQRPSSDPDESMSNLLDRAVAVLSDADPDAPAWNWTDDQRSGWWCRRMAHEASVHRWDAQEAAQTIEPIDADLATDGITELIEVGLRFRPRGGWDLEYPNGSLHLHRTDGEGEWLLTAVDGELVATFEHAKGDAAARGTASDLLLYLWGRGRATLECFGDEELLDAWASVAP